MSRALTLAFLLTLASAQAHAQSTAEMEARTAAIAERYLEVWSQDGGLAVEGVPYVYGPTVRFYGRTYTQAQLMAEKSRAIRQWPVRRYVQRPGTVKIICSATEMKCGLRSVIDFVAENPVRGTVKRGSARFDLGVSFAGPQPRILYEGGSLNNRGR